MLTHKRRSHGSSAAMYMLGVAVVLTLVNFANWWAGRDVGAVYNVPNSQGV